MLEMRGQCEKCGVSLAADSPEARICTYECTFCSACAASPLGGRCPNCSGPLVPRPRRVKLPDRSTRPPCEASRYLPREFRFAGVETWGGWEVKRYAIRSEGRPALAPGDWETAGAIARPALEAQAEGGAAFLIFHLGQDGDYLLVDWWSDRDILNQRLFHRTPAETRFRELLHESWVACVWELQIIEAERRHWTETTMGGMPQEYRARHLEDGTR